MPLTCLMASDIIKWFVRLTKNGNKSLQYLQQQRNYVPCYVMPLIFFSEFNQGQARGYGRITQKRGRTIGGHYFQDLFTAKPLDIHHLLGYQMNDLDIVFPKIPHNTL